MFDKTHIKRENDCNIKLTRLLIMWLTNLIYYSTLQTLYQISNSFLKKKTLMCFIKPLMIKQSAWT